uniref:Uncharacterized protein n=1 Tax=viral metagenome TaxID=1070528 RepID=A0A6C0K6R9_9ZZZZ
MKSLLECSEKILWSKINTNQIKPEDFIECPLWLNRIKESCKYVSIACQNCMIKSFTVLMQAGAKIDCDGEPEQLSPIIVCLLFLSETVRSIDHHYRLSNKIKDYYHMMDELLGKLVLKDGFSPRIPLYINDFSEKRSIMSFLGDFGDLPSIDQIMVKHLEQYIAWEDIAPRRRCTPTLLNIISTMTTKRYEMLVKLLSFLMSVEDPIEYSEDWVLIFDLIDTAKLGIRPLLSSIMTKLDPRDLRSIIMIVDIINYCGKSGLVLNFKPILERLYLSLGKEKLERFLEQHLQQQKYENRFLVYKELLKLRHPISGARLDWYWFDSMNTRLKDKFLVYLYTHLYYSSSEERELIDPYFQNITLKDLQRQTLEPIRNIRSTYLRIRIQEIYDIIKNFCLENYMVRVTPLEGHNLQKMEMSVSQFSIHGQRVNQDFPLQRFDRESSIVHFEFKGDVLIKKRTLPFFTHDIELLYHLATPKIDIVVLDESNEKVLQWIDLAMATWGFSIKESSKTILNNYVRGGGDGPKNIQKIPTGIIARYITTEYPNLSSQQQQKTRPFILSTLDRIRAQNIQRRKKQSQQQKQKMQKNKQALRSITVTSTLDQINKCQVYDVVSVEYRPIRDVLAEYPDNAFIVFTQLNERYPFQPHLFFRQPELPVCYRSNRQTTGPDNIFNVLRGEETILIRQIDLVVNNKIYFAILENNIIATGMQGMLPLYRILRRPNYPRVHKLWNVITDIMRSIEG